MLSVYYDKICIKFASHHLLLYVVYMCEKSLNFTYAFKCYQQNVSGFTLAGPPCSSAVDRHAHQKILTIVGITGAAGGRIEADRGPAVDSGRPGSSVDLDVDL